ncbi:MAG: GNAT family N-acetyltransferase [Azonexus sp.]|jgi:predicted N-acetyltransferase YhbS
MSKLLIRTLDVHDPGQLEASIDLIEHAFADPDLYDRERIAREILGNHPVFYRQFFVAIKGGRIVGVGGVKAADWSAKTHLLYLSAVTPEMRGQGIGRSLIEVRMEWVERKFATGRILVSTARTKRFREFGFVEIKGSEINDRHLMLYRF